MGESEEHRYECCTWILGGARAEFIRTDHRIWFANYHSLRVRGLIKFNDSINASPLPFGKITNCSTDALPPLLYVEFL